MMTYDYKMIDFATWGGRSFTLSQMMTCIKWMQRTFPEREIWMDGDGYGIVAKKRVRA